MVWLGCLISSLFVGSIPTSATIAGWSSLVARRVHIPEAAGSNPAPATTQFQQPESRVTSTESRLDQVRILGGSP